VGWVVAPDDVVQFVQRTALVLRAALGNHLIGAYFVGSVALGGYIAGESDVDILAVVDGPVPPDLKDRIADRLLQLATDCPARGLEFTLYRRDVVERLREGADFEVNVNGGPRMERTVHLDASAEPQFWLSWTER